MIWLALVFALTIYAPVELIRMIIVQGLVLNMYPEIPAWQFKFEIAVVGIFYLAALGIIGYLIKRGKCRDFR